MAIPYVAIFCALSNFLVDTSFANDTQFRHCLPVRVGSPPAISHLNVTVSLSALALIAQVLYTERFRIPQ